MTSKSSRQKADVLVDRELNAQLHEILRLVRRRKIIGLGVNSVGIFTCLSALLYVLFSILPDSVKLVFERAVDRTAPWFEIFLIASLASISLLTYRVRNDVYQKISVDSIVVHFNREISSFEESAQLLLKTAHTLNPVEQIQKEKVIAIFNSALESKALLQSLPAIEFKQSIKYFLVASVAFLVAVLSAHLFDFQEGIQEQPLNTTNVKPSSNPLLNQNSASFSPRKILVVVSPPDYTGLEKQRYLINANNDNQDNLNLTVAEGSTITWEFEFDTSFHVSHLFIKDAENQRYPFEVDSRQVWRMSATFEKTTFYQIGYQLNNAQEIMLDKNIYSLMISIDERPRVKIIEPKTSLVELEKSDDHQIELEVESKDDYGIVSANIIATVAKGSGEAVKFRDQSFAFDEIESTGKKQIFRKRWSLKSLGMEPGDEVYFSVAVKDNKLPISQEGRSSSVIVRWLDDEIREIAAEGIQIRFIPEFFRSQRQIIIETEQLIADRNDLTRPQFEEKSEELGFSQQDLKEKYGQYLGDETESEGLAMHGLQDGYHGGEDVAQGEARAGIEANQESVKHDHSEQKNNDNGHHQHSGADHGHGSENVQFDSELSHSHDDDTNNLGVSGISDGAAELIQQFSHNHGSVEVGALSSRDPKSWMKMAVSVMWQAELHLMLSDPEKSLPFQYEAYEYLKLARQADRIYVKRLGFEPPPVKESNRLTGDLSDIVSLDMVQTLGTDNSDKVMLQNSLDILQGDLSSFSQREKKQLEEMKTRLLELANSRPTMIKYAGLVERIINSIERQSGKCRECVIQLSKKLWQLSKQPIAYPKQRRKTPLEKQEKQTNKAKLSTDELLFERSKNG